MLALRAFICEAHIPDYLQFGRDIFDLLTDGLLAEHLEVCTTLRAVHLILRCIALDLTYRKIFDDLGVDYVNLADSSGHMLPHEVTEKVGTLVSGLSCPVGYHAHNNLALAMANSIAAVEAGAQYVDVTCRGLGAGAGNCQGEVLASVLDMMGYETGIDIYKLQDVAEEIVEPLMHRPQTINTSSLMLGYAGVYSSFLLHAYKASERFGIPARDILAELGRRKMVGGQEDMIVDVAYEMSQKK